MSPESSPVSPHQLPVQPVTPPAAYIGGKRALSARLVELIAACDHATYAEAFVGMGGVFFRRRTRPRFEVINDISADVTTLFRILQRHRQSFMEELKWRFSSRAEFDRLMQVDPSTLTDLERAARFLYLQKTAFGGRVAGRTYGVDRQRSRFNLARIAPMLDDVHERLQGVTIERLPFADFLRRYDGPDVLFYLDPPYHGCEADYGPGVFSPADFGRLAEALSVLQGRFLLSINDTPIVRETFSGFGVRSVALTYRISGKATPAAELFVTGKERPVFES